MVATRKRKSAPPACAANNGEMPANSLDPNTLVLNEPSAYFLANPPASQLDLAVLEPFTTRVETVISLNERAHILAAIRDLKAIKQSNTANSEQDPRITKLEKAVSDLKEKLKKKDFYIESQAVWVNQYKQSDLSLRHQLEEARRGSASTPEQSDTQASAANDLMIKNAALEQSVDILREELGKANREVEHLNTRIQKQLMKKSEHKQELELARAEITTTAQAEVQRLNELVETLREQLRKRLNSAPAKRVIELEHTIEVMHASRIYADRPPQDSEITNLQLENQRQREQLATLDSDARGVIEQHKHRISELEQEVISLAARLDGYGEEAAAKISGLEQEKADIIAELARLKALVEEKAGEVSRLKQEARRAEKNESTMLDRTRKAEQEKAAAVAELALTEQALSAARAGNISLQEALSAKLAQAVAERDQAQARTSELEHANAVAVTIAQETEEDRRAIMDEDTNLRGQMADLLEFIESKGLTYDEGDTAERTNTFTPDTIGGEGQSDHANGFTTRRALGDRNPSLSDHQDNEGQLPTDAGNHRLLIQSGASSDDRVSQQQRREIRENADGASDEYPQTGAANNETHDDHSGTGNHQPGAGEDHRQAGRNYRPLSAAYRNAQAVLSRYQAISCTAGEVELTTVLRGVLDDYAREAELRAIDGKIVQEYFEFKAWLKILWHNPYIESTRKVGEVALRWMIEDHQDEHGYAPIKIEQFGDNCGFSRQTAGRIMHESVSTGAHSEIIHLEECVVPDKRHGERKIEKKHYHLAPTRLVERPADLRKPDDKKKQGGAGLRCKKCGAENVLRHIFHTWCPQCNKEDVYYPQEALLKKYMSQLPH
jgi:hypothetical protein